MSSWYSSFSLCCCRSLQYRSRFTNSRSISLPGSEASEFIMLFAPISCASSNESFDSSLSSTINASIPDFPSFFFASIFAWPFSIFPFIPSSRFAKNVPISFRLYAVRMRPWEPFGFFIFPNESELGMAPIDIELNAFYARSSPTIRLRMLREKLFVGAF